MSENPDKKIGINLNIKADITQSIQDVTAVATEAARFVGKVMGPSISAGGGIISDQIQFWRATNLLRLSTKWVELRKRRGASEEDIKHLPFDIGVQILESASIEGNEEVQKIWAALLDAATSPSSEVTVTRIHIDILKSLTGVDVTILKFLWALVDDVYDDKHLSNFSFEERIIGIQNLRRQQCIRPKLSPDLLNEIFQIDDVLAHGKAVEKEGLKQVIRSMAELIQDLSGMNETRIDRSDMDPRELQYELTNLGVGLMKICHPKPVPTR